MYSSLPGPIGIFDSGYGGLTVFDKIRERMPAYDHIYLGDNARAPYGPRSFDVVYRFTRQAVMRLFAEGCQLVILACNTASAKALRTIQQRDLPVWDETRRVLGVIRPTVELMDRISRSKHVGVVGTAGTIASGSYQIEIAKMFPHIQVTSEACPMWLPHSLSPILSLSPSPIPHSSRKATLASFKTATTAHSPARLRWPPNCSPTSSEDLELQGTCSY